MSINIHEETLLSLSDAAMRLPKVDGRRTHSSSIWRWARRGLHGIKLEYVRVGNRIFTSLEALNRFTNLLAEQDEPVAAPSPTRKPEKPLPVTDADRDAARANAALERDGL